MKLLGVLLAPRGVSGSYTLDGVAAAPQAEQHLHLACARGAAAGSASAACQDGRVPAGWSALMSQFLCQSDAAKREAVRIRSSSRSSPLLSRREELDSDATLAPRPGAIAGPSKSWFYIGWPDLHFEPCRQQVDGWFIRPRTAAAPRWCRASSAAAAPPAPRARAAAPRAALPARPQ